MAEFYKFAGDHPCLTFFLVLIVGMTFTETVKLIFQRKP